MYCVADTHLEKGSVTECVICGPPLDTVAVLCPTCRLATEGELERDGQCGGVAEWLKTTVLKTVGPKGLVGSNPTASARLIQGSGNGAFARQSAVEIGDRHEEVGSHRSYSRPVACTLLRLLAGCGCRQLERAGRERQQTKR